MLKKNIKKFIKIINIINIIKKTRNALERSTGRYQNVSEEEKEVSS